MRWDPNPPAEEVLGYLVYVGTEPGVYPQVYDVGNQTFFVYPDAVDGQQYFFGVAAYNATGAGPSSELAAYSQQPPSLVNPGYQRNAPGQTVALQLSGTDPSGEAVSYGATGLPAGLTLATSTGLISGVGTTIGVYSVTATVTHGLLSASQSFTWVIDGGPPTVAITSPTTQAIYSTQESTVLLEGTASDDLGIVAVAWQNNRGGAGVATGTTTWSSSLVPLIAGENVIVITVRDAAGYTATATLPVISPGTPPPTVTIALPTSAPTYATSSMRIALEGTANDGIGVTQVTWVNSRGGSGPAIVAPGQSTSWAEPDVRLMPGVNLITVTAWNASGNSSSAILTVDRANNPPTFSNPGNRTNAEGDVVTLQLAGSDPDGDSLTYGSTGLPPGLMLDPSSGLVSGTLAYTSAGVYSTTFMVSDGQSTADALLTWTVTNTPLLVRPIVVAASRLYDGTTSATLASCTLSGVVSPGLVAAYSFDEGTGTAVRDLSGYGNHGSVVNAAWTAAGRYGGALLFDGIGTRVSIPDAPSLRLTAGMTLEAWVRPTAGTSLWRDVVYKGDDNYYLASESITEGRPAIGGTFVSTGRAEAHGPTSLSANTWAHLAATYDGATLRLYVNGVEVASVVPTGSLITSGYPLEIGGDSIYGQFFAGIIDEVRVYNVALTPAQIEADLMVGADAVACAGVATFDSAGVGAAKTVTVTNLTLTGPAMVEFTLATTAATTRAAIDPRPVTMIVTAADKLYDTSTGATLTSCTVFGMVGDEEVGCTGTAAFETPNAGTDKRVTVTNLALTGANVGNYTPAATGAIATASIQPRPVTPAVTVSDKRYDGTTIATIRNCTVIGVVECTGTATFDTADVGAGKTVTVTNLALTGADASNYVLTTTTTTTTAAIYYGNQAPIVTNPGAQNSFQGVSAALNMTAVDADGDPVTFSAANLPPGITLNSNTGAISGTPTTLGVFTVVVSASDGSATGQTSFSWSIASPLPGRASPVSPSGSITAMTPAFSWTADGSAEFYLLSVNDASAGSPTWVWYTPAEAGCPIGGTCTVPAPKSLTSGLVGWMVLTWNSFGYGPWSTTMNAVVEAADPAVPTPVPGGPSGPIATRTPTYRWSAISNDIWYQLSVGDALGVVREFWYSPAQACVSAPCAVTPNVLLAIGPAQWKVRAWRTTGAGAWTAPVTFDAVDSAPGTATLVSPLNPVTTLTPSFTWNAVLGTSYYLLRVTDRDNVIVDRWYLPPAVGCPLGTGTCIASPGIALKAGSATWSVLTWNGSGYGPWSATREFLVEIADPAALTPAALTPTGAIVSTNVSYRWTAMAGALSYRLSIRNGGAPIYWWYKPAAAGCEAASECSAVAQVALLNGAAEWQVQVWTNGGYGPWSSLVSLTVNIPAPSASTLVSPGGAAGSTSPAFQWNAAPNVTLYYIRAFDATGLRVDKWLTPLQVGCASGGVCTLDAGVTLASGAGSWQVIAWNPAGYSPWSSTLAFVIP